MVSKIKIALIGTHGTGKTTLTHELVVALKKAGIHAEFLGELARHCPLPINEGAMREAQEWIIYNQYISELEFQGKCDVLVCDRSLLDGYAYYSYKFPRNLVLEQFIKDKISSYDLLIKVPIREGFLISDGIRSVNAEFQKGIDKRFKCLLQELDIPFIRYESIGQIMEIIRGL